MSARKTLNIIYDGHCGFCVRSLRVVQSLDLSGVMRFHDAHHPDTISRFPSLSGMDLEDAMYTFVEGEDLYRGFFAFRRLAWSNPLTWILLPVFYFPGAAFFGPRVYAWVARNRSRFGCGSEVCELPNTLHNEANRQ